MTRQPHTSGQIRGHGSTAGRGERTSDDDRPFAEVRRNVNDAVRIVSLHRWAFVIPFCIVTSGAFLLSLNYPRTFRASTSFERRNDPIMVNLPNVAGKTPFDFFRTTMARDLKSTEYMAEVVENLGLDKDFERNVDGTLTQASLATRNALANSLASRVSSSTWSPSPHIDIVKLTYTAPDSVLGAKLLDEVKRTYIRKTRVRIREFLESQRDYFKKASEESMTELKAAQREATLLRLENPYVNPQDPGALSTKLSQLDIERRELMLRRREAEEELTSLRQMLAAMGAPEGGGARKANQGDWLPAIVVLSAEAMRLKMRLEDIDGTIRELRTSRGMTDQHPEIIALLRTRDRVEEELRRRRASDRDNAVSNQSVDLGGSTARGSGAPPQAWQNEHARLVVQVKAQQAKIKDIGISLKTNELTLQQLHKARQDVFQGQEEYADITANVSKATKRRNDIAGTLAMIEPAIKAIQQDRLLHFSEGSPARGGRIPVNPKATTIVLLAIVAGIVAGAVFVILAEILDNVFRSSVHVARSLGLPILETIDVIVTTQDKRRRLIRRTIVVPLVLACCLGLTTATGSVAYLSIQRPGTYDRLRKWPESAVRFLTGSADARKRPSEDASAMRSAAKSKAHQATDPGRLQDRQIARARRQAAEPEPNRPVLLSGNNSLGS